MATHADCRAAACQLRQALPLRPVECWEPVAPIERRFRPRRRERRVRPIRRERFRLLLLVLLLGLLLLLVLVLLLLVASPAPAPATVRGGVCRLRLPPRGVLPRASPPHVRARGDCMLVREGLQAHGSLGAHLGAQPATGGPRQLSTRGRNRRGTARPPVDLSDHGRVMSDSN